MPSKGRIHPCTNPLKRKHNKKTQYKDVHTVLPAQLSEFRKYLSENQWDDETRLCGTCRPLVIKKVKARQILRAAVDEIKEAMAEGSESDDDESEWSPRQLVKSPVPAPEVTSSESSDDDTRGLSHEQRVGRSSVGQPGETFAPDSLAPSAPPALLTPRASQRNEVYMPSPSTPGNSGAIITTSATPQSCVPSNISGSIFHDEDTAKIDLHNFLKNLGVTPPSKSIKSSKKRVSSLFGKATKAMKSLFSHYTGEELPECICDCKNCKILFDAVKQKLPQTKSKKEKYMMLTCLPEHVTIKKMHEELQISNHSARLASFLRNKEGPFSFPLWKYMDRSIPDAVKATVISFYNSDDNSRVSPNAGETRFVKKLDGTREAVPRRFMLTGLKETYQEFKRTHSEVKLGMSTFAELRPKNCKWPGHHGIHVNCTCVIHQNFLLMLEGLKNATTDCIESEFENRPTTVAYIELLSNHKEFSKYLICDVPTEECYLGYCESCPNDIHMEEILELSESTDVTYKFWSQNDVCVRTDEHSQFSDNFQKSFVQFLVHDYAYETQKNFIKALKCGPLDNGTAGVLTVDFGENYSFIVQNAVQGYHWNNSQATIHPFVLYAADSAYGKSVYKTYFVISDEMGHDATSFHCFRTRVIAKIKVDFPNMTHINYVSDGAGSQYKNYKNIGNLLYHKDDYNLSANWIFTATGHGKNTCDAMSAVVKRTVRLRSLRPGALITTPLKMFEVAAEELSSSKLEFFYITKEDVSYWRETLEQRYRLLEKVPCIRKNHYFSVTEDKLLISKRFASSEKFERHCILKDTQEIINRMEIDHDVDTGEINERVKIGEFYAIFFGKSYQIGYAIQMLDTDGMWRMQMMKKTGRGGAALVWPSVNKFQDVSAEDIIKKIQVPEFNEPGQNYRLIHDDLTAIKEAIASR